MEDGGWRGSGQPVSGSSLCSFAHHPRLLQLQPPPTQSLRQTLGSAWLIKERRRSRTRRRWRRRADTMLSVCLGCLPRQGPGGGGGEGGEVETGSKGPDVGLPPPLPASPPCLLYPRPPASPPAGSLFVGMRQRGLLGSGWTEDKDQAGGGGTADGPFEPM